MTVTVIPEWEPVTRTWACCAAAVMVTVSASGAQARMLVAEPEVMVTVSAFGAEITRPLGRFASTVTCAGGEHRQESWLNRPS